MRKHGTEKFDSKYALCMFSELFKGRYKDQKKDSFIESAESHESFSFPFIVILN